MTIAATCVSSLRQHLTHAKRRPALIVHPWVADGELRLDRDVVGPRTREGEDPSADVSAENWRSASRRILKQGEALGNVPVSTDAWHVPAMKKYLLVALFVVGGVAEADHHAPPQAAFDACAKSKQGDTCSFTGRNSKKLDGTCQTPRASTGSGSAAASAALVCRPSHHMHGGTGSAQ
jgi:hypothetical protein